jgi:hypothetical protein
MASLESLREKLYGECWMACAESDTIWRIYSVVPKQGTDEVAYVTQEKMDELAANNDLMSGRLLDNTARGHAQSLLLKRDAFGHEHEVRLIDDANNGVD